jgi:hypothetical protein
VPSFFSTHRREQPPVAAGNGRGISADADFVYHGPQVVFGEARGPIQCLARMTSLKVSTWLAMTRFTGKACRCRSPAIPTGTDSRAAFACCARRWKISSRDTTLASNAS